MTVEYTGSFEAKVFEQLARIEANTESNGVRLIDHESRLRDLKTYQDQATGKNKLQTSLIAIVAGSVTSFILSHFKTS